MVVGHILRKRRQSGIFFGRSRKEGQVLIRLSPLLRPSAVICMLPQDVHAVMLFIHISLVDTHLHPLRHDAADFRCYLGNGIFGDSKVSSSSRFRSNPWQQISETELLFQTKLVEDFGVAAFERNRSFWNINFHSSIVSCIDRRLFMHFIKERKLNKIINWELLWEGTWKNVSVYEFMNGDFSIGGKAREWRNARLQNEPSYVGIPSVRTFSHGRKLILNLKAPMPPLAIPADTCKSVEKICWFKVVP